MSTLLEKSYQLQDKQVTIDDEKIQCTSGFIPSPHLWKVDFCETIYDSIIKCVTELIYFRYDKDVRGIHKY